ncbi:MAG: PhoH family protein [Acidimicrobiia bacterium]|nr:PhoH family protein [Acidimicrobiia bacterium]
MLALLGQHDTNLRRIEAAFPSTRIVARGTNVRLSGVAESTERAQTVVRELVTIASAGQTLDGDRVQRVIAMVEDGVEHPSEVLSGGITVAGGRVVRPKTAGQRRYMDTVASNSVIFGIGPAGTGKTYLAVAAAVEALRSGEVRRILLTRPAVEAGERLGFLPGDLAAKIDPYLRPLYDALYDFIGPEQTRELIDQGVIEIAPLAYMRGRTLNDAFVILDEAQNTSPEQMKMFLTRLGFNSRMVVTGDITQVDLPTGNRSGLRVVMDILDGVDDVAFVRLTGKDVVRAAIVARIVSAYERFEESKTKKRGR